MDVADWEFCIRRKETRIKFEAYTSIKTQVWLSRLVVLCTPGLSEEDSFTDLYGFYLDDGGGRFL